MNWLGIEELAKEIREGTGKAEMMAKILIIDDEVQLRGLLARIISLEGYVVVQAGIAPRD